MLHVVASEYLNCYPFLWNVSRSPESVPFGGHSSLTAAPGSSTRRRSWLCYFLGCALSVKPMAKAPAGTTRPPSPRKCS